MNKLNFTPYQYSVLRYYHDTRTSEFLNIGIAIFAPEFNYFHAEITSKFSRLKDAFCDFDGDNYRNYINKLNRKFDSLQKELSKNQATLFPSSDHNLEDLLRLVIRKDTNYQYSVPSSGITQSSVDEIEETENRLFFEYVDKYVLKAEPKTRDDEEIWKNVFKPSLVSKDSRVFDHITSKEISTPINTIKFEYAWKNSNWHLFQPISFDLQRSANIVDKAHRYLGRGYLLNQSNEISHLYYLLGAPIDKDKEVNKSYIDAKNILAANIKELDYKVDFIEENQASDFATNTIFEMKKTYG